MTLRINTSQPSTPDRRHAQMLCTVSNRTGPRAHTVTVAYDDDPLFEDEIVTDTTVLRATVDVVDGGECFSVLVMEPESGDVRQAWMLMDRAAWERLSSICDGAIAAIDRHKKGRAA